MLPRTFVASTVLPSLCLLLACERSTPTQPPGDDSQCIDAQFLEKPEAGQICRDECTNDIAESCGILAMMLERGHLVDASHAEALEAADKACGLGDMMGCLYAGDYRLESDDPAARAEAYTKTCLSDESLGLDTRVDRKRACFRAAHAYVNGLGVEQDLDKGGELAQAACEAGSTEACTKDFSAPPQFGSGS